MSALSDGDDVAHARRERHRRRAGARRDVDERAMRACANGWKTTGGIGCFWSPVNMSPTTPTIVAHGCVLRDPPRRMRRPIGSTFLKYFATNARLTITTGSAPTRSASVNTRPSASGILSVEKNSGVTGSERVNG